jgi:predicted  nucleic acid-binding Zn-ribbon protein
MRNTVLIAILLCVAGLVFGQQDRFNGLKTKIDDSSARYHTVLDTATVDFRTAENRVKYEDFNRRYQALARQLHSAGEVLQRRAKAPSITPEEIQERRSKVESLVTDLDALKAEYDTWVRSVS